MNHQLITICLGTIVIQLVFAADFLDVLKGDGFGMGGVKKRLVVHRIGQCLGHKNLSIYMPDFQVAQHNRTHYAVNGQVIFNEDFPNGWEAAATVKKCDSFSASANCRPFLSNIANTDVCSMLAATDAIYGRYMSNITPKAQCPFRKGTYVVKDQMVDDDATRFLPGSGSTYWEVKATGKIGDRMVLCFIIQLNARPKKSTLRTTLGKLTKLHFQTLDDLFCCSIFLVSAIAFWYVLAWVVGTVVKLFFPVVVMFVFMVVFNQHYSTVLPKLVIQGTEFFSNIGQRLGILARLVDYE